LKVQYRNRLNKINKIDEEGVRNIMENINSNNVREIVVGDLDKQRNEFQKKLLEKRRKNNTNNNNNNLLAIEEENLNLNFQNKIEEENSGKQIHY